MRFMNCPNCITFSTEETSNSDEFGSFPRRRTVASKHLRKLAHKLFGQINSNLDRKPTFCQKVKVERQHKIRKRDLLMPPGILLIYIVMKLK